MESRLVRTSNDRMLAGVCGGLAQYFNIDSTIVRLVFVVAVLSGVSPLIYVLLWIVMPEEKRYQQPQNPSQPALNQPAQDPTGEWKYDPYTGEPVKK
jgi:phage shock protein C